MIDNIENNLIDQEKAIRKIASFLESELKWMVEKVELSIEKNKITLFVQAEKNLQAFIGWDIAPEPDRVAFLEHQPQSNRSP